MSEDNDRKLKDKEGDDVLYSDEPSKSAKSSCSSLGMGEASDFEDPSILIRGPASPMRLRYSKEELLALRSLPLSKIKPACLDVNSRGCWDPDRWHSDKKYNEAVIEDERIRDVALDPHKRRSDPRERIRKEQDGIVLSPQRRSFNTGCYMPTVITATCGAGAGGGANDMQLSGKDSAGVVPNSVVGGRRIGSGRILTRDSWDFRPDKPGPAGDASPGGPGGLMDDGYSFRPGGTFRDREDRYERRSFSRDYDKDPTTRSMRDGGRDLERLSSGGGSRSMSGSGMGPGSRYSNGNGPPDRARGGGNSNGRSNSGGGHYMSYMSGGKCEPEEPEWFSGGPTSQHDTIELRGFEDIPEEKSSALGKKQRSTQQKKVGKKSGSDKNTDGSISKKDNDLNSSRDKNKSNLESREGDQETTGEKSPKRRSTSTPVDNDKEYNKENCKSPIPVALQNDSSIIDASLSEKQSQITNDASAPGFILDDFLNLDSIPAALLSNGTSNETAGSRFSQFFRRESPVLNRMDSRRSSLHEELSSMLTDSNKYFTPISPAGNSSINSQPSATVHNSNLLEMLQRARVDPNTSDSSTAGGKIHNVEELEARMRHGEGYGGSSEKSGGSNSKPEEVAAFQKLLSQVSSNQQQSPQVLGATQGPQGRPMPKSQQQPMSILEMLNKSQQADENAARNMANVAAGLNINHQMGATGAFGSPGIHPTPNVHQPAPQVPPELVMKLLQVQQLQRQQQQQQLSQLIANSGHNYSKQNLAGGSPLPSNTLNPDLQSMFGATNMQQQQYAREILQRPEAQAIIQGLKHNKITVQHLLQQLNNPAIQQRHREMLIAILKTHGNITSPRNISPVGPPANSDLMQHMMLGAQQQLRVSPLPNVIPPRMPSPMELQAHTRNILQGALIKKKLEEQSENFRKRQEMQRSHSPNANNSVISQNSNNSAANSSPAKHVGSPTPLAFTPTSVLRKMTAEKEPDSMVKNNAAGDATANGNLKDKNLVSSPALNARQNHSQNRPVAGANWNMGKQPQGRPIVKGNGGMSMINQQHSQIQYAANLELQMQNQYANMQARNKLNFGQSHNNMTSAYPNMQQYNNSVQQNNTPAFGQTYNNTMNRVHAQQQHLQRTNYQHQQMLNTSMINTGLMGFNQRDGALSPTSNQLARWFSPELLAQASAGKLPPVNLAQNALSLEELERIQQSSTTVHN